MNSYPRAHDFLTRLYAGRIKYGQPAVALPRWIETAATGQGRDLDLRLCETIEAAELLKAAAE